MTSDLSLLSVWLSGRWAFVDSKWSVWEGGKSAFPRPALSHHRHRHQRQNRLRHALHTASEPPAGAAGRFPKRPSGDHGPYTHCSDTSSSVWVIILLILSFPLLRSWLHDTCRSFPLFQTACLLLGFVTYGARAMWVNIDVSLVCFCSVRLCLIHTLFFVWFMLF